MSAVDEAAAARVRDDFAHQGFMAHLGARLESVEAGAVEIALPLGPHVLQQHGFVHGGVTSALMDTACGFAALSTAAPEAEVLTIEFKINFLAPSAGSLLRVRGEVAKPGRTVTVTRARAFAGEPGALRETALMTATIMMVSARADAAVKREAAP